MKKCYIYKNYAYIFHYNHYGFYLFCKILLYSNPLFLLYGTDFLKLTLSLSLLFFLSKHK